MAVGYLAFFVGPPVIGTIADRVGLSVAFAGVGVLVFVLTTRRQPALAADAAGVGRASDAIEETAGRA